MGDGVFVGFPAVSKVIPVLSIAWRKGFDQGSVASRALLHAEEGRTTAVRPSHTYVMLK